jgi:hypothetical protein
MDVNEQGFEVGPSPSIEVPEPFVNDQVTVLPGPQGTPFTWSVRISWPQKGGWLPGAIVIVCARPTLTPASHRVSPMNHAHVWGLCWQAVTVKFALDPTHEKNCIMSPSIICNYLFISKQSGCLRMEYFGIIARPKAFVFIFSRFERACDHDEALFTHQG